jgi:hypothetical protein
MKKLVLTLGAAASLVAGTVAMSTTSASADPWRGGYYGRGYHHGGGYYRGDRWRHNRGGWGGGDALAAGAIGLGVGAILGSAAGSRPYYDDRFYGRGYYGNGYYGGGYYGRPDVVLEGPVVRERRIRSDRPVYRESYGRSHEARCAARYRSYDPVSDTFVGYDGNAYKCRL